MAFDGVFLHKTIDELKEAVDCHIDKIYQPSKDELIFLLRKKGFAKRLFITAKPGAARIQFTENKFENPATPPNFCMLLRKYLQASRLMSIEQNGFERIAEFYFSAINEMGDPVSYRLICELIGNQANVILVAQNGRIIDSLRHSDIETSKRLILPNAIYEYPASQKKLNPLKLDINDFCKKNAYININISKILLENIDGFSPLICREVEHRALSLHNAGHSYPIALEIALNEVIKSIHPDCKNHLILKPDNSPLDFSFAEITQYGNDYKCIESGDCSKTLDAFYTARDNASRIASASQDITKLLNNLKSRTEKKLSLRLCELKKCENREELRIFGELIKANLYKIENGSRFTEVENYYDPELKPIKIPLNPAISPSKNAEKYFKDYKKTYTAEQTLKKLTEQDKEELVYFESVLDSISRSTSLSEITEIRQELFEGGYIKLKSQPTRKKPAQPSFCEFKSIEGYRIFVGKNNLQNDYLTTKLASKNDLWFHAKNIHGSHVIVQSEGKPVSDETIIQAACLAAKNSKASGSAQVPVDYTPVKYVKKPNGAKPGMVIYTTNKTVYVTPLLEGNL